MTIQLSHFPFPNPSIFFSFYFTYLSSLLISPISYISFAFVGYCLLLTFDCSTLILHPFLDIQSIHLTCICEPCLHSLYEAEKKKKKKKQLTNLPSPNKMRRFRMHSYEKSRKREITINNYLSASALLS